MASPAPRVADAGLSDALRGPLARSRRNWARPVGFVSMELVLALRLAAYEMKSLLDFRPSRTRQRIKGKVCCDSYIRTLFRDELCSETVIKRSAIPDRSPRSKLTRPKFLNIAPSSTLLRPKFCSSSTLLPCSCTQLREYKEQGQEMASGGEANSSVSMDEERIEGVQGAGQEMPRCGESNSSVSMDEERIEVVQGAGQEMAGCGESSSSVSMDEETKDHNCDTTSVEDFANRPSKKPKCLESSVLDDEFQSTSSLLSECPETISSGSDNQINEETLLSSPSPTKVSELMNEETVSADDDKQTFSVDDDKQLDEPKNIINNVIYDYLPQDYTLTERDECAHCVIQYSKEDDILVKIDDISIKQRYLMCLLDKNKWLDDEVISAYICCLKEQAHAQNQNDAKVYFENPFVTRLLKHDGQSGISGPTGMTKIVKNYLNHDMIHLPINIKDSHWYLASVNFEKSDIQVLDSLCWEHNRADLTNTIRGLQYHLDILKSQESSIDHKWKDLDFTKWIITEQLQKPIQKDNSSCGLFMLKFMEYWTGHTLSHTITQKIITSFRFKLAAILLCWKNNTVPPNTTVEESDYSDEDPSDVIMSESPFDENQSKELNSLSAKNKYKSLMSVLSNLSLHELVGGLCSYIRSVNSAEALEKIWVQSSDPYPISLTLKKLQEMLNEELPMDCDCFNLVVRKMMFHNIQTVKQKRGLVSKHYLDMQFWLITDFGRHPNYRKKLDVEQLANSVRSWPGIKYSVSACKSIHIPIKSNRGFILIILEKDTRTVYILDPTPIEDMYERNPLAKYVHRILWIAEHLPKAMSKACPVSTWNENIFLWQQKIVHDISVHKRELSGFLVNLFMSTWDDGKLHLPFIKDGYELRKQMLGQLLTFKDNTCEKNMPTGVQDFISCIRKIKTNMNVKT